MARVKRTTDPITTKAGFELTSDAEAGLAAEAEAGYDSAALTRRQAGRPSLSGRAGQSHRVDLRVDDETYQAIRSLADKSNRSVSDVVRDAVGRLLEVS